MSWFFHPLKPCSYDAIMLDPPTHFEGFSPFESAKGPQYQTMSDAWLRTLPVKNLARADCLLWLWTTMPKLGVSIDIMRHDWGARYVTGLAWLKRTKAGKTASGTGFVALSEADVVLLGAYGRPNYVGRPIRGSFETDEEFAADLAALWHRDSHEALEAVRREHSRKPDEQYERIRKLMGPDARVCELFARQAWAGIEAWGDQVKMFNAGGTQ